MSGPTWNSRRDSSSNGLNAAVRIAPTNRHSSQLGKSAPAIVMIGSQPPRARIEKSRTGGISNDLNECALPTADVFISKVAAARSSQIGCKDRMLHGMIEKSRLESPSADAV